MSLNASTATGGTLTKPMEPATYPARTVLMVDLGLQARPPFAGKDKPPVNMVSVTYEFSDEFMKDENDEDIKDKPRWLTESFPLYSLSSERATSTARINALDPSGDTNGDLSRLLDVPCMVTVVHNPGKAGRVYENIASVATMRSKDAANCPALVHEPKFFDLDDPDLEVFESLPPFIQKRVTSGLEYEGSKLQEMLEGTTEQLTSALPTEELDDENPY